MEEAEAPPSPSQARRGGRQRSPQRRVPPAVGSPAWLERSERNCRAAYGPAPQLFPVMAPRSPRSPRSPRLFPVMAPRSPCSAEPGYSRAVSSAPALRSSGADSSSLGIGHARTDGPAERRGGSRRHSGGDSGGDRRGGSRGDCRAESRADTRGGSRGECGGNSRGVCRADSREDCRDSRGDRGESRGDGRGSSRGDGRGDSKGGSRGFQPKSAPAISHSASEKEPKSTKLARGDQSVSCAETPPRSARSARGRNLSSTSMPQLSPRPHLRRFAEQLLEFEGQRELTDSLQRALVSFAPAVVQQLLRLDPQCSGLCSREQLHRALANMGVCVERGAADALFDLVSYGVRPLFALAGDEAQHAVAIDDVNRILRRGGVGPRVAAVSFSKRAFPITQREISLRNEAEAAEFRQRVRHEHRLFVAHRYQKAAHQLCRMKVFTPEKAGDCTPLHIPRAMLEVLSHRQPSSVSAESASAIALALEANSDLVGQMFAEADTARRGWVDKAQLREVMPRYEKGFVGGVDSHRLAECVFELLDCNGIVQVNLDELQSIVVLATQKAFKNVTMGRRGTVHVAQTPPEQLQAVLVSNAAAVIQQFRDWDENGDGSISKLKFRSTLLQLGVVAPHPVVDKLFDSFDADSSGFIQTNKLADLLHKSSISKVRKASRETALVVARALVKQKRMDEGRRATRNGPVSSTARLRENIYEDVLSASVALDVLEY